MRRNKWMFFLIFSQSGLAFSSTIYNNITPVAPTTVASPIPSLNSIYNSQSNPTGYSVTSVNNPYLCITNSSTNVVTTVAPGSSTDTTASGNPYYLGADVRYGGCSSSDVYIGYLSMNMDNYVPSSEPSFSGSPGVHIGITNLAINNSTGSMTGQVGYTQIETNLLSPPKLNNNAWPFVGMNLSGLEFSTFINPYVIPDLSAADASTSYTDLNTVQAFLNEGYNTMRVPVSWSFLIQNSTGTAATTNTAPTGAPITPQSLSSYYPNYVQPLLETLTSSGVYVILDLHSYFHYPIYGSQYSGCGNVQILTSEPTANFCPDGTINVNFNDYINVWSSLISVMQSDPKINMNYIMLDLMNEPVLPIDTADPDGSGSPIFNIQAKLINSLRSQNNFQGYILVSGNNFTGLHSWTTEPAYTQDGIYYTNADLFSQAAFAAAGVDTSKVLINVHQYFDSNYSGTLSTCLQDLSTTGPNGFNLDAFVQYLNQNQLNAIVTEIGTPGGSTAPDGQVSCQGILSGFLQYLKDNSANVNPYGFVGWTAWSTGHGWGNDYLLLVSPSSLCASEGTSCYQDNVMSSFIQ